MERAVILAEINLETFGAFLGAIIASIIVSIPIVKKSVDKITDQAENKVKEINDRLHINGWLKTLVHAHPEACWVKIVEKNDNEDIESYKFVMHIINKRYSDRFGPTDKQYLGNTDYEVWPKDIAEVFEQHDLKALNQGRKRRQNKQDPKPIRFVEEVSDIHGKPVGKFEFEKVYLFKDGVEAIMGWARA